ncbi:MAG: methyltransferase [Janthinobacterium lividum]
MSEQFGDQHIFDLVQSAYAANALYVLTQAGVFDRLLQGPAGSAVLADELGLDASMLHDLLLFARGIGYLKSHDDAFAITRKGLLLSAKSQSWLRAYLLVWGGQLNPAFARLGEQLAGGANAFALAHGAPIWDLYASDPAQHAVFVDYMETVTHQVHIATVTAEFDADGARRLLDVGGGTGALACGLAQRHLGLEVDVCDQPSNAAKAAARIAAHGLQERCRFVGANIFAGVPRGYDLYTIKHVLHDWDDDNAGLILRRIAAALEGDARLVIVEGMLDRRFGGGRDESSYLHVRNIEQRVWTPGRVRTRADFDALCAQAGLRIEQVRHSAIADISYLRCARACAAG